MKRSPEGQRERSWAFRCSNTKQVHKRGFVTRYDLYITQNAPRHPQGPVKRSLNFTLPAFSNDKGLIREEIILRTTFSFFCKSDVRARCDITNGTRAVFVPLQNTKESSKASAFSRQHFLFHERTSRPQFVHPGACTSSLPEKRKKKISFVIVPLRSLILLAISVASATCVLPKKKLQKKKENKKRKACISGGCWGC